MTGRRLDVTRAVELLDEFAAGYLTLEEVEAAAAEVADLYELGELIEATA